MIQIKICKKLIRYTTWITEVLQQLPFLSNCIFLLLSFFTCLLTLSSLLIFFSLFFNVSQSHTHISTNSPLYGVLNSFLLLFTFLHVPWGSDPTPVCSCPQLLINIQRPFAPLLAFLSSHKHSWIIFFTSKIFSVLHTSCLFPWHSKPYAATLFPYQSLSLPVWSPSLFLKHAHKYSGAFILHDSTHTIGFLSSSNGYSVKEGGSSIYGPVLFTINSHSGPDRADEWNSSYSNLSISISGYYTNSRRYKIHQEKQS